MQYKLPIPYILLHLQSLKEIALPNPNGTLGAGPRESAEIIKVFLFSLTLGDQEEPAYAVGRLQIPSRASSESCRFQCLQLCHFSEPSRSFLFLPGYLSLGGKTFTITCLA